MGTNPPGGTEVGATPDQPKMRRPARAPPDPGGRHAVLDLDLVLVAGHGLDLLAVRSFRRTGAGGDPVQGGLDVRGDHWPKIAPGAESGVRAESLAGGRLPGREWGRRDANDSPPRVPAGARRVVISCHAELVGSMPHIQPNNIRWTRLPARSIGRAVRGATGKLLA